METLGTTIEVVINFGKYILTPIMNQLGYLYSHSGNIQSLRDQVEKLNKKRSDLQLEVDEARRNTRIIGSDVVEWIEEVDKITKKEKEIKDDEAQARKGCFYGIFPNIKLRYSLSKKAKMTAEVARGLLRNEGIINKISHPAPLDPIPSTSSVTEIDSRKSKEDEIMEALNDNNVYVIALCGMGGVGKTTMAKTIKSKVEEDKIFEEVAMVVVKRPLDLKDIQQGIAEGVGLSLNEKTTEVRAKRLHKRLKDTGSILIILDDVWEKFNLQEIGIPSKATHQRCKIILTSRNQHVCKTIEDSAKIIQLNILSEREAWNLFKEKSSEVVDEEKLHPVAREVARECKGLPLALVTVAAALRDSCLPSWEDALHQLKASLLTNIPDVREEVYVPLKWSYDQIGNEEARYIFLLCCLFPEDYEIHLHVLVEYGFSLGIFTNTSTLEEARNRVCSLVKMLIDRFLLIRVDSNKNIDIKDEYYMEYRVKIHDILRDMGISIASKDRHIFMSIHDPNLREWPKKVFDYGNYTCISLQSSTNISILENILCPRLELLHVDSPGVEIQESAFDKMEELRVLHTHMLKSFPSSLSRARNLRSLILFKCKFKHLPNEIGECLNLEIFSLCYSNVETLPKDIGKLKNLKLLDLKGCKKLRKISPGAISGLVQLEELYMAEFAFRAREDDNNASIAEVLSLKNLTILQLRISIFHMQISLQNIENLRKLKRYYVVIDEQKVLAKVDRYISMSLYERQDFPYSKHIFQVLFDNAQVVELAGDGSKEIAHKLSRHGYKEVERLKLSSLGLEFLFDSSSWNLPDISYFPCLTTLALQHNDFLKEICNGNPPNGSFSNLVSIKLFHCNALRHLFSMSVAAMLSKLESLEIWDCKTVESVFLERKRQDSNEDNNIVSTITLPRLSKIRLDSLERLGALYLSTEDVIIELPKLCEVEIEKCSSLRSFRVVESSFIPTNGQENKEKQQYFIDPKVMICGLKNLSLLTKYDSEIFDPKIPINNFMSLERLKISHCNGCVSMFSNSISKAMHNLTDMCIERCKMLQEVVAKEKEEQISFNDEKEEQITLFPQLKILKLLILSRISQFCHASEPHVQLPSLESLRISSCKLMETFCRNQFHLENSQGSDSNIVADDHSFFDKVTCIKLKELYMFELKLVTRIFGPKIIYGNFSSLQIVQISTCDRLRCIFYSAMFRGLINLRRLRLKNCPELEEVISKEEKELKFPQLKELKLIDLPKIVEFCHVKNFLDLPSLEKLSIHGCPNLKSFCTLDTKQLLEEEISFFHQQVGIFFKLETLDLERCNGFTNLFPNSTFVRSRFSNLKILSISDCKKLQEVIGKKCEEEQSISRITLFPKLKRIKLLKLPSIKQFCHLNFNIIFPSLEELQISDCELMETFSRGPTHFLSSSKVLDSHVTTSFFTEVITCNKLKKMEVKIVKGAEELFSGKISVSSFMMLEYLEINGCEWLRSICSLTVCKGLVNLQKLHIEHCPELQEVIHKEVKDVETTPTKKEIIFPQLKILYLSCLPKLVRFCHIKHKLELPSLHSLNVTSCDVLETLSIGSVHLPISVQIHENDRELKVGESSHEKFLNKFNLSILDRP